MYKNSLVKLTEIKKALGNSDSYCSNVLNGLDLEIKTGSTVGLLGESGAGKTTIAKLISGLLRPDEGKIYWKSKPLPDLKARRFHQAVKIQYIFQDPYSALDPHYSVEKTLNEPVKLCKRRGINKLIEPKEACYLVGIYDFDKWKPHKISDLSGGERQRIAIARALIPRPELIISDESTSMLDEESAQEVLTVLKGLNRKHGITIMFITHQLDVIKKACDYLYIIKDGKIVDSGETSYIITQSQKFYTKQFVKNLYRFKSSEI